ncbi:MAG: PilZ domain-containing protein [Deltaproteobacteria bacterium]|nr:PilZ domain-containing protein [Deltaproteobacteria bacterium]
MTGKKEYAECRGHERFKVKTGAIAMIRPLPAKQEETKNMSVDGNAFVATVKYCQIINISKDGLTFRYIDKNGGSNKPFELDVLFIQDSICFTYLKNVPFEIVWTSHDASKNLSSKLTTKLLGVQFGEMMPQQESQLDRFLEKCTIR